MALQPAFGNGSDEGSARCLVEVVGRGMLQAAGSVGIGGKVAVSIHRIVVVVVLVRPPPLIPSRQQVIASNMTSRQDQGSSGGTCLCLQDEDEEVAWLCLHGNVAMDDMPTSYRNLTLSAGGVALGLAGRHQ